MAHASPSRISYFGTRRRLMKPLTVLALAALALPFSVAAQGAEEARPRDLQRLQDDLRNLDEDLGALEPGDSRAEAFRQRAEEIREDTIALKVKMRRQERSGREGTGVAMDEVEELRRSIRELRDDLGRTFGADNRREVQIPEGTQFSVRLDEPLSSRTARREDRFEASVFRPVRSEGMLAIPAGARMRGIVRDVEPAQRPSKGGRLDLDFDTLYLDRDRLDIRARVVSINDGGGPGETAGKAGIGALLGGVLGGILGGHKGAIAGILIGGTGAVVGTRGDEVELPAGAVLIVRLDRPLVVPRR
jgi:hypothetical protein